MIRATIRLRLTLIYGLTFFVAGGALLAANYVFLRDGLWVGAAALPPVESIAPLSPALNPTTPSAPQDPAEVIGRYQDSLRDHAVHNLLLQSSVALLAIALISCGVGWIMAGRALRPVSQMVSSVRRISAQDLHQRIPVVGPEDELKQLGETFNDLLRRLDTAFESQRRFVANASHELRTPLAIQRTVVDVALGDPNATIADLRAMGQSVREGVDRSERLIRSLLLLARGERGLSTSEPVDLEVVVTHVVAQLQPLADKVGLSLAVSSESTFAFGDAALLERLISNLVENAILYNVSGGFVSVLVRPGLVEVSNSGPLIPLNETDELFEPFRRRTLDRTSSDEGVGLGLSIARAITTIHGGSISAIPRAEGGLTISVALPTS